MITNQQGTALVVSLLMLVLITGMGITATNRTIVEGWLSANYRSSKQAFYVAEAGLECARNVLRNDTNWADNTTANTTVNCGTINVGGRNATYTVSLRNATTNTIIVTSTGTIAGATSVVEALIERHTISVPASVYLGGPNIEATFKGNAFSIDGRDINLDNTHGPAPSVWGIAIDPNATFGTIPTNRKDNITGSPGTIESPASIGRVSQPLNLVTLAEQYTKIATMTINGNHELTGGNSWGNSNNPEVVRVNGDLRMTGNSSGAGVLIVRGSLDMQGTSRWNGIIIVLGEGIQPPHATAGSQAGTPDIYGALLVKGGTYIELDVRGNITIQYSSQAISMVNSIAPITVSSWRQVHN
jgi:hypothetical protein